MTDADKEAMSKLTDTMRAALLHVDADALCGALADAIDAHVNEHLAPYTTYLASHAKKRLQALALCVRNVGALYE